MGTAPAAHLASPTVRPFLLLSSRAEDEAADGERVDPLPWLRAHGIGV